MCAKIYSYVLLRYVKRPQLRISGYGDGWQSAEADNSTEYLKDTISNKRVHDEFEAMAS